MDINCDLGEGEPLAKTRRFMRWVTSANIACAGHAGNSDTMHCCLQLCKEAGVNAGAHPGFVDREYRGRRNMGISVSDLQSLIESQAGALERMADQEKISISHIKLHGALYHIVEQDERLSEAYVVFVKERFPGIRIFAFPSGRVLPTARRLGMQVWGEIFADRAYEADGSLRSRAEAGALLEDFGEIRMRMETFLSTGRLPLKDGTTIKINAQTVCVHADSPGALRTARLLAKLCSSGPHSDKR
jgi:UPF0271 protein